jgi:ABC-type glycerol-3-phosphate transport system permease component
MNAGRRWLIAGGALSTLASALHLAVIAGGPDWYRFFGVGEEMARAAERGSLMPAVVTLCIAILLAVWAAYAFSGAGLIRRLPLARTALILISGICLARGLLIVPVALYVPYPEGAFDYWSSLIVLAYGLIHAVGTWRAWPAISGRRVREPAAS